MRQGKRYVPPLVHRTHKRPPRLGPPGSRGLVDWVKVKDDLITGSPGVWYLIGNNVPSRLPGQRTYMTKRLGVEFVRYFGVEVYAKHLPPRHDDLPSGYNVYIRKTRQKKEAGK